MKKINWKDLRYKVLYFLRFNGSALFYKMLFLTIAYVPSYAESRTMEMYWTTMSYYYWTLFKIQMGWNF